MAELTKEEKKAMLKRWKNQQNRKYVISKAKAVKLFRFLSEQLEEQGCDETLKLTKSWLEENVPTEKQNAVLSEIKEMGGLCDCEVLLNCYERYDIDI